MTDSSEHEKPYEVPNPEKHPVKAAEKMLRHTREAMSGDLYDEHREVRTWAASIEWACTALEEHEDSDHESMEEDSDYDK